MVPAQERQQCTQLIGSIPSMAGFDRFIKHGSALDFISSRDQHHHAVKIRLNATVRRYPAQQRP